ncbi:hypothetical protein C9422_22335 [Pseudomonas sp. B1(2018)]|nr:hypothetical protein C9422_22335 [Pseudomonas sp. B1(2018)]
MSESGTYSSTAQVGAVRLYEQMALLSLQRPGSYRLYTAHRLTLVQMIRTAQAVGFTLGRRNLRWTRQGRGCPKGQSQALASGPGTSRSSFLCNHTTHVLIQIAQVLNAPCVRR